MRRTRLLDATRDLVWHTEALAAQFARARARAAARSGISESQHRVLRTIASSSYCLSLSDLARQLRISPQASQRIAAKLGARGLLLMMPNPDDRRTIQVRTTPVARALLAAAEAELERYLIERFFSVDTREIRAHCRWLLALPAQP